MNNERAEIGKRIAAIRKRRKMTQTDLANKLGIEQNSVSNYERGSNTPSIPVLITMSKVLDCSVDELLGIDHNDNNGIESNWKKLIFDLESKGFTPDKIRKILELYEQIQKLIK